MYQVRDPDDGGEWDDIKPIKIRRHRLRGDNAAGLVIVDDDPSDAEEAARLYAEREWWDCGNPETMDVEVRASDGTVTRWRVRAETDVRFIPMKVEDG